MRVRALLLLVIAWAPVGALPADQAQPILAISSSGHSREYSAAELLARSDIASISVPGDVSYDKSMTYRAVPLLRLLGDIPPGRFDTLEARATDGFVAQIPLELITEGPRRGAVAWLAIEDPAHRWPPLPHRSTSAGPFYLVWKLTGASSIGSEQWPFAIASITLVDSPTRRWPQLALPADRAGDARARAGQRVFFSLCLPCHKLNGGGAGSLGPDLGRPMNATQYLTEAGLRAMIRDPRSVRSWPNQVMRGFDQTALSDADLDALITYLQALSARSPAR